MLRIENKKLIFHYDAEEVWIEAWGENALRIRATKECRMPEEDWALCKKGSSESAISFTETGARIENGKIYAEITKPGKITVYRADGRLLLEEYCRNRRDVLDKKCSAIEVEAREFKPIPGGAECCSGAANEVWSYGEEVYEICKKYMALREKLRPYTRKLMEEAHEKGTPVMRTLFYMYPDDARCWEIEDAYFYGPDILVAPILYAGARSRSVYLPEGETWTEYATGKEYQGGQVVEAEAPLDTIPVFVKCL